MARRDAHRQRQNKLTLKPRCNEPLHSTPSFLRRQQNRQNGTIDELWHDPPFRVVVIYFGSKWSRISAQDWEEVRTVGGFDDPVHDVLVN